MPDDHSQRAYELFEAVMEKQENQRSAFLEQACAGDDTLRTEVESLIAADAKADNFLEPGPRGQESGPPTGGPRVARVGARFGAYHIRGVIASGGMGTVYEAVQEHPRRTVALKALKRGIASRSALRRFEHESQILARLRHPCIAQVYEAGTYDDGVEQVPYFAMEYIPGARPITRYATDRNLGTRERLELFAHVCDAVHHGHQKGIIHRDLKPGNLLVNSSGQVKIIDFGVARSTDSDMAVTTQQTDIGQLIGTLQYMSPEQCQGDPHDIDTRSDVYALGAVLYELLCGSPPYDVTDKGLHEATCMVCEQRPIKPSTINRALRGDVETIVLKALEKDRERRYRSVAELEEDIKRYLRNDPIIARPPSITYQLRVFARRNRTLFGAVAAVFTMLVGGIIVSASLYVRAEHARAEAERARAQAEAVTDFLNNDMLAWLAPSILWPRPLTVPPNLKVTARDILDLATNAVEGKFEDQPLVEASIRTLLGNRYRDLGTYDVAEEHLQRALELRGRELGEQHVDTLKSMFYLAGLYSRQGRYPQAEARYDEALQRQRRVLGEEHEDTLASMHELGVVYSYQGRHDEAKRLLEQVFERRRRILGEHPGTADTLNSLACLLHEEGDYDGAKPLHRKALEMYRKTLGHEHPCVARSLNNLARTLYQKRDYEGAGPLYREALRIYRKWLGDEHPGVGRILNNLASLAHDKEDYNGAESLYREALRIYCKRLGDEHADVANSRANLGTLLRDKGDWDEAESLLRQAVEGFKNALGADHWKTANARSHLGECLTKMKRYADAEQELLQAHPILNTDAAVGPHHRRTRLAVERLVLLYEAWGKPDKAAEYGAMLAEPVEDPAARRP